MKQSPLLKRLARLDWRQLGALGIAYLDNGSGGELGYDRHPFEVVPFAWQGGDGLQYAFLVHDEALEPTCVSFAPVDEDGPVWLGDDLEDALANLLALHAKSEPDAVKKASRALGVKPARRSRLTRGGRSKTIPTPPVPRGWRFMAHGHLGVLAPKSSFERERHALPRWPESQLELARARALLDRGFPASALFVARNVYARGDDIPAARVMREAYLALDRPFLAARVDAYLAQRKKRK